MEVYEPIDFNKRYHVSNKGNVMNSKTGRILSKRRCSKGYCRISIPCESTKKYKDFKVHRLVAIKFCNPPTDFENLQVNHIDGDKNNNFYENLEWVTPKENVEHAFKTGLHSSREGENNSNCKLSDSEVKEIRGSQKTIKQISKEYGISEGYARRLLNYEIRHNV